MALAVRRKNRKIGVNSAYLNIPRDEATIAANRLILADPRGEISEKNLLEFMERYVEPAFWKWWQSKTAVGE